MNKIKIAKQLVKLAKKIEEENDVSKNFAKMIKPNLQGLINEVEIMKRGHQGMPRYLIEKAEAIIAYAKRYEGSLTGLGKKASLKTIETIENKDWKGLKSITDTIKFVKNRGNKVKIYKWKLGDGWKVIVEYDVAFKLPNGGTFSIDSSEGCVLYALKLLCEDKGIKFNNITDQKVYTESKKFTTGVPKKWNNKDIKKLLDDLEDINYHTEREKLEDELNM